MKKRDQPDDWPPPLVLENPACAGMEIEIFFPSTEVRPEGRKRRGRVNYERARQVCMGCEERTPCLEYALRWRFETGCFGGLSPRERRILRGELRKAALENGEVVDEYLEDEDTIEDEEES